MAQHYKVTYLTHVGNVGECHLITEDWICRDAQSDWMLLRNGMAVGNETHILAQLSTHEADCILLVQEA